MKALILAILCATLPCGGLFGATPVVMPPFAERMANAIWRVEGGAKAKVQYGILSVKVKDAAEARKVCLNTIRNNYNRWIKAGADGDFIDYLGTVYCPPSADPKGHVNWVKNVRSLMGGPITRK